MRVIAEGDLSTLNTLRIPSESDYLVYADTDSEVVDAIRFARDQSCDLKVLGGGSNVVLPSRVSGVVLKLTNDRLEVLEEDTESVLVRVGAGHDWHSWVMTSLEKGWYGLENLAYIPGTVGASPVQNIGAYGVEVESFIETVHYIELKTELKVSLSHAQCEFAYRESIFKQALDQRVAITHVDFRLNKTPAPNFGYAPLNQFAEERGAPTPEELAQWVIEVRRSKLPDPAELPNAGSFFKNPVISQAEFDALKVRFPDAPSYLHENGDKVPAGWLIDRLGFKGRRIGPVGVHEHQALVLVNFGGDATDVGHAADEIKAAVFKQYGVRLEQEPRPF